MISVVSGVNVQLSHPQSRMETAMDLYNLIFDGKLMLFLFFIFAPFFHCYPLLEVLFDCASFSLNVEPVYLKDSICSSFWPFIVTLTMMVML